MREFQLDCGVYHLSGRAWEAAAPRACVVLLHGVGEYALRHNRLAVYLMREGISVYAMDLPGHGRSPGRRGHIGGTDAIMRDINVLIAYARRHCPDVPFFVMGHSEYDADTLAKEYFRDLGKGMNPKIPAHYFPNDDPTKLPPMVWRSNATLLYTNWLNYYVYQQTPYDLEELKKMYEED